MTKHIHYDKILAWANGADIEFRWKGSNDWIFTKQPLWDSEAEYRVKPDENIITYTTRKLFIDSVEGLARVFLEKGIGRVHPSYKEIGSVILAYKGNDLFSYHNVIINTVTKEEE